MQLLASAEEMRRADAAAIQTLKIPGIVLMENAGRAFVDCLIEHVGQVLARSVHVICGKGNNGGDGFVIARHLVNRGANVNVVLLSKREEVKGDAKTNLDAVLGMLEAGVPHLSVRELRKPADLEGFPKPGIIVDAIFGTGFTGSVRGLEYDVVEWINRQDAYVASVDIASGTNTTDGTIENVAVRARLTITMGLAKIGQYVGAGREHQGIVIPVDISIPDRVFADAGIQTMRVDPSDVASMLPRRPLSAHKYSVGKVFVLAGSMQFTGAPFMCAQAAMRTGAGAVVLGVPRSIREILARKVTEVMIRPLDETAEGTLSLSCYDKLREQALWSDVIALGPGLSRNSETGKVVERVLKEIDRPVVLDADGINALGTTADILKNRKAPTILTPHPGELGRLLGQDAKSLDRQRVSVAGEVARELGSVLVFKGAPSVIGIPDGRTYVNPTGNPGMASAGVGDVLTGIIAGLYAQGMSPGDAAVAGVYVHGLAGDMAAQRWGLRGVMAMDLVELTGNAVARAGGE
jgi:ADP-dependent NAD(P)H-hydrate dehydratase / NAD(P)H-hydrate epimerase